MTRSRKRRIIDQRLDHSSSRGYGGSSTPRGRPPKEEDIHAPLNLVLPTRSRQQECNVSTGPWDLSRNNNNNDPCTVGSNSSSYLPHHSSSDMIVEGPVTRATTLNNSSSNNGNSFGPQQQQHPKRRRVKNL